MIRDSLHGLVVEEVELGDSRVRWGRLVLETVRRLMLHGWRRANSWLREWELEGLDLVCVR
jgi:hypothetical protein